MTVLSRGARLCEQIIRTARPRRGGRRVVGRPYLARRLGCTVRTVSRYVAELRAAGRLDVTPPKRERVPGGWRTVGTNSYGLPCKANPAPHVTGPARFRRSRRDDTGVTPPPKGGCARGRQAAIAAPDGPLVDPAEAAAAMLARIAARDAARRATA